MPGNRTFTTDRKVHPSIESHVCSLPMIESLVCSKNSTPPPTYDTSADSDASWRWIEVGKDNARMNAKLEAGGPITPSCKPMPASKEETGGRSHRASQREGSVQGSQCHCSFATGQEQAWPRRRRRSRRQFWVSMKSSAWTTSGSVVHTIDVEEELPDHKIREPSQRHRQMVAETTCGGMFHEGGHCPGQR